mgnify:CR=1 FL=1
MLGFRIPSVNSRIESNVGYIKIKGFYKDKYTGIGCFGATGKNALTRIFGKIELKEPVFSNFSSQLEIYSKDNYNLYVFKDSHIGPDWGSTQKGESVTYNGSSYYKWTICDNEYVHIIFQNGDRSKQSGDSPKLYGGYRWRTCCSGCKS